MVPPGEAGPDASTQTTSVTSVGRGDTTPTTVTNMGVDEGEGHRAGKYDNNDSNISHEYGAIQLI